MDEIHSSESIYGTTKNKAMFAASEIVRSPAKTLNHFGSFTEGFRIVNSWFRMRALFSIIPPTLFDQRSTNSWKSHIRETMHRDRMTYNIRLFFSFVYLSEVACHKAKLEKGSGSEPGHDVLRLVLAWFVC